MIKTISVMSICRLITLQVDCGSALELGSGEGGMIARLPVSKKVGMDHWVPSLEKSRRDFPELETVCGDIRKALAEFGPNSFDLVCGFDILEHLLLNDAMDLMHDAEQIARKLILWWGPLEDTPRFNDGLDGNPSMAHVRCIKMDEFAGYEQIVFPNYVYDNPSIAPCDCFLAWKDLR